MNPIRSEAGEEAIQGRIVTFEQGLGRFGLSPGDIDIVIHTHLHNEHCENDFKCEDAVFSCHPTEQGFDVPQPTLLGVDLGLRTGLALFSSTGRLMWYRSAHFGSLQQYKRSVFSLIKNLEGLDRVVVEGGGKLAQVWIRETSRRHIGLSFVSADQWRRVLLLPRERRDGATAKKAAQVMARAIIVWSEAKRPTTLRHDAAEAICVGLYGVLDRRWLAELPSGLRP